MQGVISKYDGNIARVSKTDGSEINVYGIAGQRIPVGTSIEYELVTSQSNPARKYYKFIKIVAQNTASVPAQNATPLPAQNTTPVPAQSTATAPAQNTSTASKYLTVTELNNNISEIFVNTSYFGDIWVEGEVTNYDKSKQKQGEHLYFSIKDDSVKKASNSSDEENDNEENTNEESTNASSANAASANAASTNIKEKIPIINCIIWNHKKLEVPPALEYFPDFDKGKKVGIHGKLRFYDKTGSCSIHVDEIVNLGNGLLTKEYYKLKKKLEGEGLFDPSRKVPVKKDNTRVGIITSAFGDAINDIEKIANDHNPNHQLYLYNKQTGAFDPIRSIKKKPTHHLYLYDVNVQGVNAVSTILTAFKIFDKQNFDCLILTRGGGSIEDLEIYNDEDLIRAAAALTTPFVSAIGHEKNKFLLDDVADLRCSTPSDAIKNVIEDIKPKIAQYKDLMASISLEMQDAIERRENKIGHQLKLIEAYSPQKKVDLLNNELKNRMYYLRREMQNIYNNKNNQLRSLHSLIEKENPIDKFEARKDKLNSLREQLRLNLDTSLKNKKIKLEKETSFLRVNNNPMIRVNDLSYRINRLSDSLRNNMNKSYTDRDNRCYRLSVELHSLSPTAKLINGFGYISVNNKPLSSIDDVSAGDNISVQIKEGIVNATVNDVKKENLGEM